MVLPLLQGASDKSLSCVIQNPKGLILGRLC
jgi:hypothetical protein